MHSPTKTSLPKKAARKNTFSQANISQSEVGDFQGGYFVMSDASASKENDSPPKAKNKAERSPARRKQYANDGVVIPVPPKERGSKIDFQDCKKLLPQSSIELKKECIKGEILLTPGSFATSNTKSPKQAHTQFFEPPHKGSLPSPPNKDLMSTSPPPGRWAGPAFGNAPHPSALPLPEWTAPSLSTSPPVHDGVQHLHRILYSNLMYPQSSQPYSPFSPSMSLCSDAPPSSIPVVPFPYVVSSPPATVPPSLAQLSTDLRRMLNINGGPIVNPDHILVSANSS